MERELSGPAVDQYFASEAGPANIKSLDAGTVNWLLTDNQGTVRDVVQYDGSETVPVDHLVYSASGALSSQTASAAGDQPRFYTNGTYLDPQTLMNKMGEPLGRPWSDDVFASYDPDSFGSGTTNLTEYVRQQPDEFHGPQRAS